MTRLVMLEIGGLGFVRSIRPSSRKLRSDVCVVIVDEPNKALWFWMGSGVQYDKRRTAKSKAEQISLEGHRIGDELIGSGFSLVEIDQDGLENPTTANNYNNLIALLDSPMEITTIANPKGTLIIGHSQGSAPETKPIAPATPVISKPSAAFEPARPDIAEPGQKSTKLDMEAALRNFLLRENQVVGVDFEEGYVGSYNEDLVELCASILDTDPLFTKKKFQLCNAIFRSYARQRRIRNLKQYKHSITPLLITKLWETSARRGNPSDLIEYITLFEKGHLTL